MKRLIFFSAAVAGLGAVAGAVPAAAKLTKLPPYPEALRCAALTGAAMKQATGLDRRSMKTFDHALFWGLAAADAARKAKLAAPAFEAELAGAVTSAGAEIQAGDAATLAELDRCVRDVPPLKGKKRG